MKNPSFRAAVALPAVLLLALGASLLGSTAAMADSAAGVPASPAATEAAAPTAPSATAAPTGGVTAPAAPAAPAAAATAPAPAAGAPASTDAAAPTPSATATPATGTSAPAASAAATRATASATSTPTTAGTTKAPAPTAPTAKATATPAAAPAELTITSPLPDRDGLVRNPGSRTVTIEGTAPVGTVVAVREAFSINTRAYASTTTTATTFALRVTFPAQGPYDLLAEITATVGAKSLTPSYIEFVFDAPRSAAPTITSPANGSRVVTTPLPFGLSLLAPNQVVTGTGTPGDDILLFFTAPATTFAYDEYGQVDGDVLGAQLGDVTVGDDGTWSADVVMLDGAIQITAAQVEYWPGDFFEPVTHVSPLSAGTVVTVGPPAGTVVAPVIEHPTFTDDVSIDSSFDSTTTVNSGTATPASAARSTAIAVGAADPAALAHRLTAHSDAVRARSVPVVAAHPDRIPALRASRAADLGSAAVASAVDTTGINELVDAIGITVRGTADSAHAGRRLVTVSGTGTPGDHVVLFADVADRAYRQLDRLYPGLLESIGQGVVPDSLTTASAFLPPDPGTITVDASGRWSGTVSVAPGPVILTAFATEPSAASATPRYSVAAGLIPLHVVAPVVAAVDPAGTPTSPVELAMTGSTPWPVAAAGAALMALGVALTAVARRRRAA